MEQKPLLDRDNLNKLALEAYGRPWNEITPEQRRAIVHKWNEEQKQKSAGV